MSRHPDADDPRLAEVAARLERLPPEAWDSPSPPPLRAPTAASTPARRRALVLRPAIAGLAATAVLALGVGIGLLVAADDDTGPASSPPATARVTLAGIGAGQGRAHGSAALLGGPRRRVRVRVAGLAALPSGYYELWALNSGKDLVALGSFEVSRSGRAEVDVTLPAGAGRFGFLDVSREPADGNPAHSGASVLRGPLS